jgi:chromate reductase
VTTARVHLLLVSGSTRRRSTNGAALRTALQVLPTGVDAVVHEDLGALPQFNPDDDHDRLPASVVALRAAMAKADAVVFCTPEYAGTLPGTFKNLLDWTVGGGELYGKPVAWVNVAGPGRGTGADATLATVLGYVGARILDASGLRVPVARDAVGSDGLISDDAVRDGLREAVAAIVAELPAR